MSDALNVGLIGCGAVVHMNYAKVLRAREEYRVSAVFDTNEAQAASAAELFDAKSCTQDELISSSDAIVVSTPPNSHFEIVNACLDPGKIVLCEKPFTTSRADAERLIAKAVETGADLYVGQFRRTFPQVELARDLVQMGLIGDVESIDVSEGGRFTWSAFSSYTTEHRNGGVAWDTGAHTIDTALFAAALDSREQFRVSTVTRTRDKDEPSHELSAELNAETERGNIALRVRLSRRSSLPNVLRISGSRGSIALAVDMDDRVRVTTPDGSRVVLAASSYTDLMECFDIQTRAILTGRRAERFAATSTLNQIAVLEALTDE